MESSAVLFENFTNSVNFVFLHCRIVSPVSCLKTHSLYISRDLHWSRLFWKIIYQKDCFEFEFQFEWKKMKTVKPVVNNRIWRNDNLILSNNWNISIASNNFRLVFGIWYFCLFICGGSSCSHWAEFFVSMMTDRKLNSQFVIVLLAKRFVIRRTRLKCHHSILFLVSRCCCCCCCACLLHSLWKVSVFLSISFRQCVLFFHRNPFDAIVFDFMSRIFQRFFIPVCLFISFRNVSLFQFGFFLDFFFEEMHVESLR